MRPAGKEPLLDRRVCDHRTVALTHPRKKVVLDAALLQVVEHLIGDDDVEAVLQTRQLIHVLNVEVADAGVGDLLIGEQPGESVEHPPQGDVAAPVQEVQVDALSPKALQADRKSTRLNSSHVSIS